MKRSLWSIALLTVLILALTGCSLSGASPKSTLTPATTTGAALSPGSQPQATASQGTSPVPTQTAIPSGTVSSPVLALEGLLESIYSRVNPSVVNIQVLENPQTTTPLFPGLQPTPGGQQYSSALGSGFVWDTQGHIITNNHVIAGASSISVTFSDGTIADATVVGADPDSDLAVIKVNVSSSQLHPVKLADSSQIKVGQLAVTIGNPFGLQGTMTVGFISGLGRLLPTNENAVGPTYSIPEIIQTDAPINPGNSGGVLLNANGNVIGVTSAIATESGSSAGVGFAIPSTIVQKVVPSLIQTGHYDHPWLGVSVITLTPDIDKAMNLNTDQRGALVEQVMAESPASKAGLQASQDQITLNGVQITVGGDVITGLEGKVINSSDDLVTYLSELGSVGQTVSLTVLRNGKEIQVPVTLAARPSS